MKNLIIIGAGGMGRSFYYFAKRSLGYETEFVVKGFLDDNLNALKMFKGYPPVLETVSDYTVLEDDVFTCSIGDVLSKKKCIDILLQKKARFISLIDKTAEIQMNARVGNGCVLLSYAAVGVDAVVGDFTIVQSFAGVSHDCIVGRNCRIDKLVTIVGGVKIGDDVTIHTGAVISHNVVIGNGATVGANSFVIRKVKSGATVCGNPAIRLI
jgi:sugar O-acyltransferase (sialic acid O-acetyltransferase NeuD family)